MRKVLANNESVPKGAAPHLPVTKEPKLKARGRRSHGATGPNRRPTLAHILDDRFEVLHQVLRFRQFLESGFDPKISDAEIVVIFADVRGFTNYCRTLQREMQDRKIQNVLSAYVKIFTEGLFQWVVEHTDKRVAKPTLELAEIQKHIIPSMYKNLGDGLMITWEIPPGMDLRLQGALTHAILQLTDAFAARFCYRFHSLAPSEQDAYSQQVQNLLLGFGIAKGHAWRLDFGHSIDYAGSIINLASRLEGCARPFGTVATYDTSPWLFDQFTKDGEGHIGTLKAIKGYEPVKVWVSREVEVATLIGFEPLKRKA